MTTPKDSGAGDKQANARKALHKWLKDAPGGEFLPDDILDREPIEVLVSGEDGEKYFWQMFTVAYTPVRQEDNEWGDEGDVYLVPQIVADCLAWYSEGDYGWSVEEL